jgi:hypothetical protein
MLIESEISPEYGQSACLLSSILLTLLTFVLTPSANFVEGRIAVFWEPTQERSCGIDDKAPETSHLQVIIEKPSLYLNGFL